MPGTLRPDAECPWCARLLTYIIDTTHGHQNGEPPKIAVTREYFHGPGTRKCVSKFESFEDAQQERHELEVHA